MKILILVFVLANLGMLAWNQWFVEPPETLASATIYEGLPEILLASEETPDPDATASRPQVFQMATGDDLLTRPEDAQVGETPAFEVPADNNPAPAVQNVEDIIVAVADSPTDGSTSDGPGDGSGEVADLGVEIVMSCRSIGPFERDEEALAASETLTGMGFAINPRAEQEQRQVGYWVSIPPLADRPSAEQIAEDLRNSGISDFYIVPTGEDTNAISLGVFSQSARAERRAQQVRDNGFASEVSGRFQTANVTWLEIRGQDADSLDSGVLGAGDRPLEIRQDCEPF